MDAGQVTPRHGQVTRLLRTARQNHGIEILVQLLGADGFLGPVGDLGVGGHLAHDGLGLEDHAFGLHLFDTAVNVRFVELEVGNAKTQQSTDRVVLLEHGHIVADAGELLGRCHAGGARPHDGHLLARLETRRLGLNPTFGPGTVDDRMLDRLDAHGVVVDVQHASGFAGCGADPTREVWEVVGRVQYLDRVLPIVAVHQIVEIRNDVVDRATAGTKRCAAVHAACALDLGLFRLQSNDELFVVFDTRLDGLVTLFQTLEFQKASDFSHFKLLIFRFRPWPWRTWPSPRRPSLLAGHPFRSGRGGIHAGRP